MAESQIARWTVVIVVEEDENLGRTYKMPPSSRVSDVIQHWKDDLDLIGDWVFLSASEDDTYYDEWMTLEMVGQSFPRMVCLKAELRYEPMPRLTNEIFVYLKNEYHRLFVKPQDKLYKVVSRLPGKPECFEYNGSPLNLSDTVQQAGLHNHSVIRESLCSVAVKLSSGETVVVQMPSDSLVLQLKEKINFYEINDFSLTCHGRNLQLDESVAQLKFVQVATAEFIINVNKRCISWKTKASPIPFTEFLSQLAVEGNIETKELETFDFICIGCQRRICQSDDDIQQLPVECCKHRSLALNAVAPSSSGTNWNGATKNIEALHDILIQYRMKGSTTETCRSVVRGIEENFQEARLDYNTVVRCSDVLLKRINELEETIKELKAEKERMIQEKERMVQEKERLVQENERLVDEMEERLRVKLLLLYHPNFFSPASCPEVTSQGQWPFEPSWSFVKCRVPGIRPGSTPFEEAVAVLQPLFRRGKITGISQWLGSVAGRTVTMATSRDGDEMMEIKESPFCDIDGAEHSWEEAGKPEWWQVIGRRGSVFVCGGGRRTFMEISWW